VTIPLKFFFVMSHLPDPVMDKLRYVVRELDEGLQAGTHKVSQAIAVDSAFNEGYVDSNLTRALVCSIIRSVPGVSVEELSNGGCELGISHKGIERRFRLRRAERDSRNFLVVKVSSDSFLAQKVRNPTLFDQEPMEVIETNELWVLAYLMNRPTRTLLEVFAARPTGLLGDEPPYKLEFGAMVEIPISAPIPPRFRQEDEDLDLGDETAEGDEENGDGEETA
jgi:hypothetical protein